MQPETTWRPRKPGILKDRMELSMLPYVLPWPRSMASMKELVMAPQGLLFGRPCCDFMNLEKTCTCISNELRFVLS